MVMLTQSLHIARESSHSLQVILTVLLVRTRLDCDSVTTGRDNTLRCWEEH